MQKNISLHDKNWFNTGGKARYFCEPRSEDDFRFALNVAKEKDMSLFVLGQGANILISDQGFDGLVVRPALKKITVDKQQGLVTAGAGSSVHDLIDRSLESNLLGLEEFAAIPGTVGGAVYINIHYFNFLLSDFLVSARVLCQETLQVIDVDRDWFSFGYNTSKLLDKRHYLVSATFQLKQTDSLGSAYAQGRRDEITRQRHQRYPYSNTCGSFFRNFHDDELPFEIDGKKIPFIAYYLDKIGVKGQLSYGGASVSHKHANMIVTKQGATSSDVIGLARKMQHLVYEQFGVLPQAECQFVGFDEYPLKVKNLSENH